ncbi:Hypothetical protein BEE65_2100 [Mycobacterium tuberculosis]|uniref:HNH endonuclease signature motif containing protein n=1 Tax=Mycobacterium tuberculosis TaxID=1773 RepID=UPI00081A68CF|nr:HNH endonuclease signature motif containing protein [Mycobacterium tuberculosis]ANZ82703.1 Hypothetical protein BEE65_2100 [Mycobacterium tuberculosis]
MSSTATSGAAVVSPAERVEVLFEELAELAGQRNAIDGRIVEIVAELDRDGLWGVTGARSVAGLVAWKMGCSSGNAHTIATVARRLPEFPRCARGMREGRLSLDRGNVEAFLRLVEAGWDAEVARRPHGQHTTVVMHLDVQERAAGLHLGPLLSESERRYLLCDATFEAWFERDGQVIGCGRTTRQINRRLRRALEHRDRTCVVPGCGATRGLHAHHIRHWQDGGATELANLVLVCPYHHRAHHRGLITITGPADNLTVADSAGRPLSAGSLARASTKPPPAVAPWPGPTGERADWWWYEPFQPQPPPISN